MLDRPQPRSLRACSRDDPECGARRGVLRRRLVTVAPGGPGPRPPGTTTWLRGARCTDPKATARRCRAAGAEGDGSAAPRPKTATVERREASVPRHGTQGASQAPGVSRHDTPHGCSAEHPNVSRRSAHPSIRVSEAKVQAPGAENAPRERDGLFDIVRWKLPRTVRRRAADSAVVIAPSPTRTRACPSSGTLTRP